MTTAWWRSCIGMLVVGAAAWCGWASAFPAGTRSGQTVWGITLAGVLAVDVVLLWLRRRPDGPWMTEPVQPWPRARAGGRVSVLGAAWPWVLLGVVVLAWEILGIDTGRHQPHLTLSALTLAFRPVRATTLAAWSAVGVYFAAVRGRAATGSDPRRPQQQSSIREQRAPGRRGASGLAVVAPAVILTGARLIPSRAPLLALLEGDSRAVGIGFWIGVAACAVGIEWSARRIFEGIVTFDTLLWSASQPRVVRLVMVGAWVYAGWHLFAH